MAVKKQKKRKKPKKRLTTEAEIRAKIARCEELAEHWTSKAGAALRHTKKNLQQAAYYSKRLEAMATKREKKAVKRNRAIELDDLE